MVLQRPPLSFNGDCPPRHGLAVPVRPAGREKCMHSHQSENEDITDPRHSLRGHGRLQVPAGSPPHSGRDFGLRTGADGHGGAAGWRAGKLVQGPWGRDEVSGPDCRGAVPEVWPLSPCCCLPSALHASTGDARCPGATWQPPGRVPQPSEPAASGPAWGHELSAGGPWTTETQCGEPSDLTCQLRPPKCSLYTEPSAQGFSSAGQRTTQATRVPLGPPNVPSTSSRGLTVWPGTDK